MKLLQLSGNNEHFLLPSMMVYTFMIYKYTFFQIPVYTYSLGGYEEAKRHTCNKFMPEISPGNAYKFEIFIL